MLLDLANTVKTTGWTAVRKSQDAACSG